MFQRSSSNLQLASSISNLCHEFNDLLHCDKINSCKLLRIIIGQLIQPISFVQLQHASAKKTIYFFSKILHISFLKPQTRSARCVSANQPPSPSSHRPSVFFFTPPPLPPPPSSSFSFSLLGKCVRSTDVREINGFSVASTLPSTCARPARALFYHLSRRSRAHDRCSVGERGWEGGGRCTLRRELATRRGRETRRQGEGR